METIYVLRIENDKNRYGVYSMARIAMEEWLGYFRLATNKHPRAS